MQDMGAGKKLTVWAERGSSVLGLQLPPRALFRAWDGKWMPSLDMVCSCRVASVKGATAGRERGCCGVEIWYPQQKCQAKSTCQKVDELILIPKGKHVCEKLHAAEDGDMPVS
jgi:hypothetical protein